MKKTEIPDEIATPSVSKTRKQIMELEKQGITMKPPHPPHLSPKNSTNQRKQQTLTNMFSKQHPKLVPKPVTDNNASETEKCDFNKLGMCMLHNVLGIPREVTKTEFKNRGGKKGWGPVKTKVKKYICLSKKKVPVAPNIATKNFEYSYLTNRLTEDKILEGNSFIGQNFTHNSNLTNEDRTQAAVKEEITGLEKES